MPLSTFVRHARLVLVAYAAAHSFATAAAGETGSSWVQGHNSRARLVAGSHQGKPYAGIVIEMPEGWKTYWRHPGDAGGVPPAFDWARSGNLTSATVHYPAPKRLRDAAGDAIGYQGRVVFPVRLVAKDPAQPIRLSLQLEYGVCKDICIPAEATLALDVPAALSAPLPAELAAALDTVPRTVTATRPTDPRLVARKAVLDGAKPHLQLEVEHPGGVAEADAFIEAPDGIYVPQPSPAGPPADKIVRYTINLETGVDPGDLRSKTLVVTLVGAAGHSQVSWQLD